MAMDIQVVSESVGLQSQTSRHLAAAGVAEKTSV
jgi:hypothetical protein